MFLTLTTSSEDTLQLSIEEGLPDDFYLPLQVECHYSIIQQIDFIELNYKLNAEVKYICQRCGQDGCRQFSTENKLAICKDESIAERLMKNYETIVEKTGKLEILPIIRDEILLSAILKHPLTECFFEKLTEQK